MRRVLVFFLVAVLGLIGFVALELLQRQFGIGRHAENPQRVHLAYASRAIVGGGRAILGWADLRQDEATFEIRCADVEERFVLEEGESSEEICGIRTRWIESTVDYQTGQPRLVVLVSWAQ